VGFRWRRSTAHREDRRASTIVGESYLVVDTGPWIFGKKVLLPPVR